MGLGFQEVPFHPSSTQTLDYTHSYLKITPLSPFSTVFPLIIGRQNSKDRFKIYTYARPHTWAQLRISLRRFLVFFVIFQWGDCCNSACEDLLEQHLNICQMNISCCWSQHLLRAADLQSTEKGRVSTVTLSNHFSHKALQSIQSLILLSLICFPAKLLLRDLIQAALIPSHAHLLNVFFRSQTHAGINDQEKADFFFFLMLGFSVQL